jgi:putative glutamine amidotransferase
MAWGDSSHFINTAYISYVKKSGFEPILVCPDNDIQRVAEECEGLLLPGGIDLDPTFYGEENYSSYKCDPARDKFERQMLHTFVQAGKKIFGICRGFQLIVNEFIRINPDTAYDLMFYQHVSSHSLASDRGVDRSVKTHSVQANAKKLYGEGAEQFRLFINSIHHQALRVDSKASVIVGKESGDRLEILAETGFGLDTKAKKSSKIVEAVNITVGKAQIRAVQWHPEELMDTALLANFFEGASNNDVQDTAASNMVNNSRAE